MITVQVQDCVSFLDSIPPGSADLFFADPPYNLGYAYDQHKDTMPDPEYYQWCFDWLDRARSALKPTGSLFVLNIPRHAIRLAAHLMDSGMIFQHWITWEAGSRPAAKKPIMPTHYALLWFTLSDNFTVNQIRSRHRRCRHCAGLLADYGGHKDKMHPFGPVVSDVWTDIGRSKHKQRGKHPCKLPEKFMDRVIRLASNPGDLVVDPFIGAGTTAVACARLGRNCLGADLSARYVEMTHERLGQTTLPMFAAG